MPFLPALVAPRRLTVPLGGLHRTLSWAVNGGGFREADTVVWHEVDGKERVDFDRDAIVLLTSRDLTRFESCVRESDGCSVRALATVGLGNALRAGDPPGPLTVGTINLLVQMGGPLDDGALVEALALAAEARTAAVLAAAIPSRRSPRSASGTGTDCIVAAAPSSGGTCDRWAGKHTLLGSLIGGAVDEVISRGVAVWLDEQRRRMLP